MYDPAEDSFALEEEIVKHCQNKHINKALDMGTGSGFLANVLLKYSDEVLACDVNSKTLESAKKKYRKGIVFIESNLFSKVSKHHIFDLIVFNPPYLREDDFGPDIELTGGYEGVEVTIEFLREAASYLSEDGNILFIASSLANIDMLESEMLKLYEFEVIKQLKLGFETLFVYKCSFGNNLSDQVDIS